MVYPQTQSWLVYATCLDYAASSS